MNEKLRREQLVARLPNITRLNGSGITESERIDAERAFIRLFMDNEDKPDRSVHDDRHSECVFVCLLSTIPACPSLMCFFNRGDTEGTNSSKVFCLMFVYVLFYVNLCHD